MINYEVKKYNLVQQSKGELIVKSGDGLTYVKVSLGSSSDHVVYHLSKCKLDAEPEAGLTLEDIQWEVVGNYIS